MQQTRKFIENIIHLKRSFFVISVIFVIFVLFVIFFMFAFSDKKTMDIPHGRNDFTACILSRVRCAEKRELRSAAQRGRRCLARRLSQERSIVCTTMQDMIFTKTFF